MRLVPLGWLLLSVGLVGLHLAFARARSWVWKAQLGLGLALAVSGAYLGLSWAPPERYMGEVQRILYVHVPLVWMGLLALGLNFLASVGYLLRASRVLDALAEASAEVGVAFGAVGLAVGAIWGRPTWGVWWSWDPRMTATVAMLALYGGYLLVRRWVKSEGNRASYSAMVACLVSVVLPVVWFSVSWWSSLHQPHSTAAHLDPRMLMVLGWNGVAFLCCFFALTYQRYLLARAGLTRGRAT